MRALIQRVSKAYVEVNEKKFSSIDKGLLVLLGVQDTDDQTDITWLSNKIIKMRLFEDDNGKMNQSIEDIKGQLLIVSQFTLHASTKKGNRPSYTKAAKPAIAIPLYTKFIDTLESKLGKNIQTGKFGSHMELEIHNDGPVTIIIDTKNKF